MSDFEDLGPVQGNIRIPGNPANNISVRQNNPFNIKGKFWGATGTGTRGFAIYPTPEAGVQAGISQIKLDQSRPMTFAQFAEKYAPAYENPTWKQDVKKLTGASDNTPLSQIPTDLLVRAVAMRESSTRLPGGYLDRMVGKVAARTSSKFEDLGQ